MYYTFQFQVISVIYGSMHNGDFSERTTTNNKITTIFKTAPCDDINFRFYFVMKKCIPRSWFYIFQSFLILTNMFYQHFYESA